MPASAEAVMSVLQSLMPESDTAVLDFLTSALQEADTAEEIREVCEPWLASVEDADALLVGLSAVLIVSQPATTSNKNSCAREAQSHASGSKDAPPATLVVKQPESGPPSARGSGNSSSEEKRQAASHRKAKTKVKTASKTGAKQAANQRRTEELLEVTAEVSRFHKEAVQDEITSALDVDIKALCISIAGRDLLVDAHLKLCPGQRYGFIGRNGCGKSSLLRAIENRLIPGLPEQCQCLLVAQEDIGDDRSAVEAVISAHEELTTLREEEAVLAEGEAGAAVVATRALRSLEVLRLRRACERVARYESKLSGLRGKDARKALLEAEHRVKAAEEALESTGEDADASVKVMAELALVRERLAILDPGAMRVQVETVLKGLGFKQEDLTTPTRMLSGGWRMRVAIARALFVRPNVLMLDEPTNHLDWKAILWLEGYLQSAAMEEVALVVVSHDRDFLDNISTMIMRIHDRQLLFYQGNYSVYEQAHQDDQAHRADLAQRVRDKREKVEKQVAQMEQKGRKTNNENLLKQVASRRTKLGLDGKPWSFNRVGLEGVGGHKWRASYGDADAAEAAMATESSDAAVKLNLKAAAALGFEAALLQCREVVIGYEARQPLIRKFDLDIRVGSRVAILGVNGSGKTTLLRTLAHDLAPLRGEVYRQPRAVVGFFNQHQADALPGSLTPVEVLRERHPDLSEPEVRSHLGRFGVGHQAVQPIETLSGGEKCRVALAAITMRPPHVLLLDEPTNHLDLATVEALSSALREFDGAVIVSSHDRRLLREVCSDFYSVQGQQLAKLRGLDEFLRQIQKR